MSPSSFPSSARQRQQPVAALHGQAVGEVEAQRGVELATVAPRLPDGEPGDLALQADAAGVDARSATPRTGMGARSVSSSRSFVATSTRIDVHVEDLGADHDAQEAARAAQEVPLVRRAE